MGDETAQLSRPLAGTARLFFDDGGGLADVGNIPDISIEPAIKTIERYVCMNGERVLDFNHTVGKSLTLKLKLDDLGDAQSDNLARVFVASTEDLSVPGGSVSTPEVFKAYPGRFIRTAFGDISGCVLKNSDGATTYVANTDYAVDDAAEGLIKILTGGAITPGQDVKLTYDYAGAELKKVIVLGKSIVEGKAVMLFKTSKGKSFTYIIHRCELKAEGGVKLVVENWSEANFTLNVLPSKDYPTEPFGRLIRRTA